MSEWPYGNEGVEWDPMIPPDARMLLHIPANYWKPLSQEWIDNCHPAIRFLNTLRPGAPNAHKD